MYEGAEHVIDHCLSSLDSRSKKVTVKEYQQLKSLATTLRLDLSLQLPKL